MDRGCGSNEPWMGKEYSRRMSLKGEGKRRTEWAGEWGFFSHKGAGSLSQTHLQVWGETEVTFILAEVYICASAERTGFKTPSLRMGWAPNGGRAGAAIWCIKSVWNSFLSLDCVQLLLKGKPKVETVVLLVGCTYFNAWLYLLRTRGQKREHKAEGAGEMWLNELLLA